MTSNEQNNQAEHHELPPTPSPAIYVASLADYNAGTLHGQWLGAHQSPEQLHAATAAMLARSKQPDAEEWAIHDHQGFGTIRIGEYETFDTIAALAAGIDQHGNAFTAWAAAVGGSEADIDRFEAAYLGQWESLDDYAEHILDDLGYIEAITNAVPEHLRPYLKIDNAGLGRDLQLSGDIWTSDPDNGTLHIFDAHA